MRPEMFTTAAGGRLVPIAGRDPRYGSWTHVAFVPNALPDATPHLDAETFNAVAESRAALAALDASSRHLPNPALLRRPTLRREAQSTSALEGTYAPLETVLVADEAEQPASSEVREVLNYVRAAEHAFAWHGEGRPVTSGLLCDVHRRLVAGTTADGPQAGRVREIQVAIALRAGVRIQDARFVPSPPGADLERQVRDVTDWIGQPREGRIDPVVASAMAHYQFEVLHPFNDGNGRIGRLLIVLQLMQTGVLGEPSLTVSPWFEARRADYYDRLMRVSTHGDWDAWVRFFARGLAASADETARQLRDLVAVQDDLKEKVRAAGLRAENAVLLVDFAVAQPVFTVRQVERRLGVSYARANGLVGQLVSAGVLRQYGDAVYDRHFTAPDVMAVMLR